MEPKYSILYFKQNMKEHIEEICRMLRDGKKVFWFGTKQECEFLNEKLSSAVKSFFLQVYDISGLTGASSMNPVTIIDGEGIDTEYAAIFDQIEEEIPAFNAAQYRVEHCAEGTNIVVKASAGTGKTTVMIDRILYLMHTVPGLRMSDIYMITFTNEATNQMNDRLQEMLLKKYNMTKNKRYLSWLEQQSQMHISTIDSLAYDLFKRFGSGVGYGRDLKIQHMVKERKDLFKDLLSEVLSDNRSIMNQIGMTYSQACKLLDTYWMEFTRKGYTIEELLKKDWGKNPDRQIENFQKIMKTVYERFEEKYSQVKHDMNAVTLNDLFFDFGHYLLNGQIDCDGLELKYLFVDEFQDTDATQIRTFANLVKKIGAKLFVVGDIKQSIYAFKGATDEAFDLLHEQMEGNLRYYSLRNNYRTCSNIMRTMEEYFFAWTKEGLLQYEESVRPFKNENGQIFMEYAEGKNGIQNQTVQMIQGALSDLELDIKSGKKNAGEKSKVAVIVRGNNKALEIAQWCREAGMSVVLSSDRPFFMSQAVRDFYAMISSYVFGNNPTHIYNYLMTPYADYKDAFSVSELEQLKLEKGKDEMEDYLRNILSQTKWHFYQREFRLRPVLAVLKDIVKKEDIVRHFVELDKSKLWGEKYTDAKLNKQALIDAKQYQKNLDKLMDLIQQRMDGNFVTLYDLYVYLTIMIATDREEMEPDVDMVDDYSSVYIMTVHKSKGLEFDTVIMPAMTTKLDPWLNTTILVDDENVGWFYKKNDNTSIESVWFEDLFDMNRKKSRAEGARLLYVAMTRAVNRLFMLVQNSYGNNQLDNWSAMIRKVGLINEQ